MKRRIYAISVLGLLAFVIWAAGSRVGEYISAQSPDAYAVVTVRSGDTLWSIARAHGPAGWDTRKTVEAIRVLNGLDSQQLGSLQPGDEVKVPRQ